MFTFHLSPIYSRQCAQTEKDQLFLWLSDVALDKSCSFPIHHLDPFVCIFANISKHTSVQQENPNGNFGDTDFIKILKDKKHTAFTGIDCFYKSQRLRGKFSFISPIIFVY